MPAVALTDHGAMFGIKEFCNCVAKKNGGTKKELNELNRSLTNEHLSDEEIRTIEEKITATQKKLLKPILGCETYVARRGLAKKELQEDRSGYHLVLLAKNLTGYHNLCKMVSVAYIDGFYYRPRIDHQLLEKYSEGLIATSACLGGEIHKKIEAGDLKAAEEAVLWHKRVFGDDFYIELQRHKTDKPNADRSIYEKQQRQNVELINLARKTNTKIIATNDVHFVEEEHGEAHDRLICLSTGKDLDDPSRMRYSKQEWMKTPEEMWRIFSDIPEALENTLEIADKIEFYTIDSDPMMPVYPIPESFGTETAYREKYTEALLREEFGNSYDSLGGYEKVIRVKLEADFLHELAWEGAKKRYSNITDELIDRVEFELNVMKTMGFPGYFLIVQDFISAARKMDVSVGPGRGSAAGSVVAYCLGITDIDPLKYDLLFERFLNPDRISMPDIDIDFDDDGRGQVLRWVTEKYGKERVAHIITYGTMATKSSIKDVARVQKLPLSESERLAKLVPAGFSENKNGENTKVNITNCLKYVPELRSARYSDNSLLSDTLKYAEMLEGTVRQVGVHACGVIIGADDLSNVVPLSTAMDKETQEEMLVTQYEGSVIEEVGLIKMDFLGLKTLSIIKEAIANIKKSKGIDIEIDKIPIDDAKTYDLFSKGQTVGTFQFESPGMQKYLMQLQPSKFEDLIAMNALYRPGPMQYIPQFIRRKHGKEAIDYPFPEMEKRLEDTYGITVYQEQVMLLSRDLAGFTRGQSDELRKAMGKKMIDKMAALKVKFIEGATKNGFGPIEKIEKIWNDWAEFAKYAFNKSHATCYSLVAYQTAYLKAHYPSEFMAANLTRNIADIKEVAKFMDESKSMGINVLGPDINESDLTFSVNKDGDIRFGLGGIKGVGKGAVAAIVEEREKNGKFTSIFDFFERVNLTACNKKTIESLGLSGAFDNLGDVHREQLFVENSKGEIVMETLLRYGNKYQSDKAFLTNSLFGGDDSVEISKPEIPFASEWSPLQKLNKEKELIGIYLSAHPLDEYEFEIKHVCNTRTTELKNPEELLGRSLKIGGIVTDFRHGKTKNDRPYGVLTLEDYEGSFDFYLFGDTYLDFSKYMIKDMYLYLQGVAQEKGADFKNKWKKPESPDAVKEYEVKIRSIDDLASIKNNLVKDVKVSIPLDRLTDELAGEMINMIKGNSGKTNVYFQIYDKMENHNIRLFSRQYRIDINKQVYLALKTKLENEIIDEFDVN
jgi:DNA polymerase-3 subunit alpha